MNQDRQKLYSRRNFLETVGIAVLGAFISDLKPVLPESPYNPNPKWVERNGVLITREDIPIQHNGKNIYAKINEVAFLGTLNAISATQENPNILNHFLNNHQLRLVLQAGYGDASYRDTSRITNPEIYFSKSYLTNYLDARITGDEEQIKHMDTAPVHELWHLWQDAANTDIIRQSERIRSGGRVSGAYALGKIGYNISGMTGKRTFLKTSALVITGGIFGGLLGDNFGYQLEPDENEAYTKSEELINRPEFAKFRGQYFRFENA